MRGWLEKLAAYKERLTAEEKTGPDPSDERVKKNTRISPSSPEELALIPMLERKDIKKEAEN